MGFFKKSEKQLKIQELEKRLSELKNKYGSNITEEDYQQYQEELNKINQEMESLIDN